MTMRETKGVVVLTPTGHLYEGEDSDRLERCLDELIARGASHVVVDLAEAGHLSARAIGILAHAHSPLAERGGCLAVRGLRPDQRRALDVTQLSAVLDIRDVGPPSGAADAPTTGEARVAAAARASGAAARGAASD